jgi:putative membrane protein
MTTKRKKASTTRLSHGNYLLLLCIPYAILWMAMAFSPFDRRDWVLENLLVVVAVVVLATTYRRFPLSRVSYTLIFVFMCLHTIGSHYTYAEVPYDRWFSDLTGTSLNALLGWERNNFDRVVHLCYGLLLTYPAREVFLRIAAARGFWGYFLPLDVMMSTSMLYELIEWAVAELVGGNLGMAYLGTQGDVWDAHKDMALASLGALIAMSMTAAINAALKKDFAREWGDSLRVKQAEPLGEVALEKMLRD